MLTEDDVVDLVSSYLKSKGYTIDQKLTTYQKGIDIEGTNQNGKRCFVEAKGATSSKRDSIRFGKEFNSSQIKTHIGVAIVKSFQILQLYPEDDVYIALPENTGHLKIVDSIFQLIKKSGVKVLLANEDGSVEEYI